jgi:hypothetical protein
LLVPAITPTVNDALRLILVGFNSAVGISTVTPPTDWSEYVDTCTTHTTSNWMGIFISGIQLTNQKGVLQASVSGTFNRNCKESAQQITFSPEKFIACGIPI